MSKEYITYKEYSLLCNKALYWLFKENKKFNTRGEYSYQDRVADYATIRKVSLERGDEQEPDSLLAEAFECAVFDNMNDLSMFPNYITRSNGEKIDKTEYTDMCNRVSSYEVGNKKSPDIVYRLSSISNDPDSIADYFFQVFGKSNTIDGLLIKIKNKGYSHYYDDKKSNKQTVDDIQAGKGANCTDSCQLFWHLAQNLGYDVKCVHVKCSGGDGHVRLQLRHPTHTNGLWINRDPACVLSNNGKAVSAIWCSGATVLAVNPVWFMNTINR